jgi:hypothetical protein
MMLVNCLTNLRTFNFMQRNLSTNKHKYLTLYQAKDLAGRIFQL